jgi:hypothetical protein
MKVRESVENKMMQQSSRRPPSYPVPASAPAPVPARPRSAGSVSANPPAPPHAYATATSSRRSDVVVRTFGLKLLSVVGILHASVILMALVVILVMALGGDARIGLAIKTIKQTSTLLWTWTLFALFTSFVLGFVLLYNAIATLSLTPWSERTTKLWSVIWLALSLVAVTVNLGWIYPVLKEASPDRFGFARTLILTCLHIAVGVMWPGFVLFYMNTRPVKRAYARVASGASAM